jgi:hypothetical protein
MLLRYRDVYNIKICLFSFSEESKPARCDKVKQLDSDRIYNTSDGLAKLSNEDHTSSSNPQIETNAKQSNSDKTRKTLIEWQVRHQGEKSLTDMKSLVEVQCHGEFPKVEQAQINLTMTKHFIRSLNDK